MTRLLDISLEGTLLPTRSKRATNNAPAKIIAQIEIDISDITDIDAGRLARFVGQSVEFSVLAEAPINRKTDPRPLDIALAEQQERVRPGPAETCRGCARVIGDDEGAIFHTPIEGPPTPLCGRCALEEDDLEVVQQRRAEEREAFVAALNSVERTSELQVALVDAYDSSDQDRQEAARVVVGLEGNVEGGLPTDPDEYTEYLRWLREGDLVDDSVGLTDEGPIEEPRAACLNCDGTGEVGTHPEGQAITCTDCNGSGLAPITEADPMEHPAQPVAATLDGEPEPSPVFDPGALDVDDEVISPDDGAQVRHDANGTPSLTSRRGRGSVRVF